MSKQQNKNALSEESVNVPNNETKSLPEENVYTDIVSQIINDVNGTNIVAFGSRVEYIRENGKIVDKKVHGKAWKNITTSQRPQEGETVTWRTGEEYGIVMIDVDYKKAGASEESLRLAKKIHDDLRKIDDTLYQETRNGAHIFYKYTDQLSKTDDDVCGDDTHVDIRSKGGCVFIGDPMGGEYYGAIEGEKIEAWTQMHDAVLRPFLRDTYTGETKATPISVPTPPEKQAGKDIDDVLPINGVRSYDAVEREALRKFGSSNKGSRNRSLVEACGWIARYLKDDTGVEYERIAKAVAYSNNPPETEREIMATINSIRGAVTDDPSNYTNNNEQSDHEEVVTDIPMWTLKKVLDAKLPPIKFNMGGWLVMNKANMLSAQPGETKSTTALYWAHCIATGKAIYGELETTQMNTLYLDGEDDVIVLNDRARNFKLLECDNLFYISKDEQRIDLYNESYKSLLLSICKDNEIKLLIIDSMGALMQGSDSDQEAVEIFHEILNEFIRNGITVLVLHHNNKGAGSKASDYSLFDHVRGSTKIQAFYRSMVAIKPAKEELPDMREFVQTKRSYRSKSGGGYKFEVNYRSREDGSTYFKYSSTITSVRVFKDAIIDTIEDTPAINLTTLVASLKEHYKDIGTINDKSVNIGIDSLKKLGKVYEIGGKRKNARHFFVEDIKKKEAKEILGKLSL